MMSLAAYGVWIDCILDEILERSFQLCKQYCTDHADEDWHHSSYRTVEEICFSSHARSGVPRCVDVGEGVNVGFINNALTPCVPSGCHPCQGNLQETLHKKRALEKEVVAMRGSLGMVNAAATWA